MENAGAPAAGTGTQTGRRYGPATVFAVLIGLAYVVGAVWGFNETGMSEWTSSERTTTIYEFRVNPLHNLVHLVVGVGLLGGALRSEAAARVILAIVAFLFTFLGLVGFLFTGGAGDLVPAVAEDLDVLGLNVADNWLHLVTAAVAMIAVVASDRDRPRRTARP